MAVKMHCGRGSDRRRPGLGVSWAGNESQFDLRAGPSRAKDSHVWAVHPLLAAENRRGEMVNQAPSTPPFPFIISFISTPIFYFPLALIATHSYPMSLLRSSALALLSLSAALPIVFAQDVYVAYDWYSNSFIDPEYIVSNKYNSTTLWAQRTIIQWADNFASEAPWCTLPTLLMPSYPIPRDLARVLTPFCSGRLEKRHPTFRRHTRLPELGTIVSTVSLIAETCKACGG